MSRSGRSFVSLALGAAVLVLVLWMGWSSMDAARQRPKQAIAATEDAASTAPEIVAIDSGAFALAEPVAVPATVSPDDAGSQLAGLAGAPRSIKLGVVFVLFAGAEGASSTSRSKAAAYERASKLAERAKTDFHGAVGEGDVGSSDDIGRIPRGVLDPRTELAVFTLSAGEVSSVLETPRGYWIVKRIE